MTRLDDLLKVLLSFEGIVRKQVLPDILSRLRNESFQGNTPHSLGEDSAAIGTTSDEFVLLTTDAIVEELCVNHPYAAGFNAVLACIMDIYAAGGTPTSFAVALSYNKNDTGDEMLRGLIDASNSFRVPIVRGHTNPTSQITYIVGSATGTVRKNNVLTAGGARPGDALVLLYDSHGERGRHYRLGWDSVTGRTSDEIHIRLSLLNEIATEHLVSACKDVSMAGLVGTVGMMMEYSEVGGALDLDSVDRGRPQQLSLEDWLRMYVSLGFLVAVPPDNLERLNHTARAHRMTAVQVGVTDHLRSLRLRMSGEERVMFDFSHGPVLTPSAPSLR